MPQSNEEHIHDEAGIIIRVEDRGVLLFIRVAGHIKKSNLPKMRKQVDDVARHYGLMRQKNMRLLIDCQDVGDVDSSAVAGLLMRMNQLKDNGHKVGFINVPQDFQSIVDIHQLNDLIVIFPSKDAALKELLKIT